MAFKFEIEVYGEKIISRKILRVGARAQDMAPAFVQTADQMRGFEKDLFDSEGASSGKKWDDLQQSTIDEKLRSGLRGYSSGGGAFSLKILQRSGALMASLTKGKGQAPGDDNQVLIVTPSAMVFGTTIPYARAHQLGRGVPQRRPLAFSESQKRDIIKGLQRYILTDGLGP